MGHSQDVWIYHSKFNDTLLNTTDFNFGILACDNCFNHIAHTQGFVLINNPYLIHCIHLHNVNYRIWKINNVPRLTLPHTSVHPIPAKKKYSTNISRLTHYND